MNIFILSMNPKRCAIYYNNVHLIKIILEIAQMMCTCLRILDIYVTEIYDPVLYKKTHINHPCNKWLRESSENYRWTYELFVELCREYTFRYGKVHACETKFIEIFDRVPAGIPIKEMTPFALAMPEKYKIHKKRVYTKFGLDEVHAYRRYYMYDKKDLCFWKNREKPHWFD